MTVFFIIEPSRASVNCHCIYWKQKIGNGAETGREKIFPRTKRKCILLSTIILNTTGDAWIKFEMRLKSEAYLLL